jgi:CRISPR system Cascade subunit CasA
MNLLTDPVFRVETAEGIERMSLPALLAALGRDRVESLPGLQRHQEDAFHIFLCYLAGAVLARDGSDNPIRDEAYWRDALRRLAGREDDCAWTLVVDDPTLPAFMQAPVPKATDFSVFKPKANTPDALDVLPTAKNHDLKSDRAERPRQEDWIYALVSLQTMSGFFGQGNYGIARMNGGFGSRPMARVSYRESTGIRWKRELHKLLAIRPGLLEGPWNYRADGWVLTWLPTWDLKSSLAPSALDPFFIEIARAVRLVKRGNGLKALGASTKSPRIAAKEAKGLVGDPWIPVNSKNGAALTVSPSGFTPELLRNLIFEEGYELTAMQRPDPNRDGQSCQFAATVLVRGQGTTDGFHAVAVPIPGEVTRRLFRSGPERDRLARLSKTALGDAGEMQHRVLKPAVLSLIQAGPEKIDFDKREISAWWSHTSRSFTDSWGQVFFPWLWQAGSAESDDAALRDWRIRLKEVAWASLGEAVARYPARDGRRYRARVKAEGIFYGSLHKHFPELKEKTHDAHRHKSGAN